MLSHFTRMSFILAGVFLFGHDAFADHPTPTDNGSAGRIDARTATGPFSGGGVVLTAEDLRRIAADGATAAVSRGEARGPRGGGGRILIVECNGAFGYESIQSAVDDALDGDTVVILPNDCSQDGRWHESVNLPDITLRIQGANPEIEAIVDATVVDSGQQGPHVFRGGQVTSVPPPDYGLTIEGLTIRGAGNGIETTSQSPVIRRCKFPDIPGSAIRLTGGGMATIESCAFDGGGFQSPAIYAITSVPRVEDCRFSGLGSRGIQVVSQVSSPCDDLECGGIFGCDFINIADRAIDVSGKALILRDSHFSGNEGACVICGPLTMSDSRFEDNVGTGGHLVMSTDMAEIERCDFIGNQSSVGILWSIAKLSMQDCNFESNAAPQGVVYSGTGGEIERCVLRDNDGIALRGTVVSIKDTQFEDNRAGPLMLVWLLGQSALIERTEFTNNSSTHQDLIRMPFMPEMRDCAFESNDVPNGGVVRLFSQATIENCDFTGNTTKNGAVNAQSASESRFRRCDFASNSATSGSGGISGLPGGEIADCRFTGNSTQSYGGAVSISGTSILNCLFVGNRAGIIGGAVNGFASPMSSCTVVGNRADNFAGGVYGGLIENSIIYHNRGRIISGRDLNQVGNLANIFYCDIQDFVPIPGQGSPMTQGLTVIARDPRFVDPGHWDDMGTPEDMSDDVFVAGDYHLLADSPCIDSGDPAFVPVDMDATDFDDEPRVMSCRVDMGVDEFTQGDVGVIGDFDGDGNVNVDDLPEFLSVMLDPFGLGVCLADINGDDAVNGLDVSAMVALLLGS